jgi:hypothetical protein
MDQFVTGHPYLFYAIVVILGFIVAFFIRQWFRGNLDALEKITESVSDLYNKYNDHETRLSHLEGEHKIFSQIKHGGK